MDHLRCFFPLVLFFFLGLAGVLRVTQRALFLLKIMPNKYLTNFAVQTIGKNY